MDANQLQQILTSMQQQMQQQMQEMHSQHQEEMRLILQGRQSTPSEISRESSTAFKVKCLADSMVQFEYDPENNQTFEAYYKRYESVLTTQADDLDEPTKVHLLLQKFPQPQYQRYADIILPKSPQDRSLAETVETLKLLFGHKETKFAMRHRCFSIIKREEENFCDYAARINKNAEKFDIKNCTADDFKVLLFVSGLKSTQDSVILEKLLTKVDNQHVEMEKAPNDGARALIHKLNLQDLVNEAERITCMRSDKGKVGETITSEVHSIHQERFADRSKSTPQARSFRQGAKHPPFPCPACGEIHWKRDCPYISKDCSECNKQGHKTGFCEMLKNFKANLNRNYKRPNQANQVTNRINVVADRKFITPIVNGATLKLQFDTAADMTIISKTNWTILGQPKLTTTSRDNATSAAGTAIPLLGAFNCSIKLSGCEKLGVCYVTPLELNLFGIPWINTFDLWRVPIDAVCNQVSIRSNLVREAKEKFPQLFSDDLGCYNKGKVSLKLKPGAVPIFRNARPVPQAARQAIAVELERLQHLGIITPIKFSQWAAPIVVVKKKNGQLRICADYSTGLNNALEPNKYPLPTPDQIFAKFAGKKVFSTIDLSDAFFQVEVDDESKKLMTINTHQGLFQVNRLQQGIKTAPGEFQAIVDMMLSGISTFAFIDDMVCSGENDADHRTQLFKALEQIQEFGFKLNITKCNFGEKSINFCGHIIDDQGIRPHPEKIWKVESAPQPTDVKQLRSFLGSVNYYGKFIKSMKEIRGPLDKLLKNGVKFVWEASHQNAFIKLKKILSSELVLTHFDPRKNIVLATDASKDGMGAALMHRFADGSLHPIMHFAATFNAAEKQYSQIEKEARALIFGLKRSHFYIAGRRITVQVDHKPLLAIFGSKTGIPVYTANRLQRWALVVMAYDIKFEFIGTSSFGYVDIVSRLMLNQTKTDEDVVIATVQLDNLEEDDSDEHLLCFAVESAKQLPITFADIQQSTNACKTLQEVIRLVKTDRWPQSQKQLNNLEVAAYFQYRNEIKIHENCLFRGEQIVIPKNLRQRIINDLHTGHPGVCRMKLLAADKCFWPNISHDIENVVKSCGNCAKATKSPSKCTLQPWPVPTKPWIRIHIDYAGPIDGFYFIVIVDAYSKWPEIFKTTTTTAMKTIEIFSDLIARHGLCETCVTDNGPQFVSETFETFCKQHGIKHLTTAFYSAQSNGQAERFVDLLKTGLKKIKGNVDQKLREFLMTYRYTPSYNLGKKSPFELMSGRQMRTKYSLLKPDVNSTISNTQAMEKQFNTHHGAKWKQFNINDEVFYKLHTTTEKWKWVPGVIKSRIGNVIYNVNITTSAGNRVVKAHANQIKRRYDKNELIELFELPDFNDDIKVGPTGDVQPIIQPILDSDSNIQEVDSDDGINPMTVPEVNDEAIAIVPEVNNEAMADIDAETEQATEVQHYNLRENRGTTSKFNDYVIF